MFGFITGKLKTIVIAALAVLLPILYILGRRDQKSVDRVDRLEDALDTEKDRADFYRDMDKYNHEIEDNTPSTRDDIIKRLRERGL